MKFKPDLTQQITFSQWNFELRPANQKLKNRINSTIFTKLVIFKFGNFDECFNCLITFKYFKCRLTINWPDSRAEKRVGRRWCKGSSLERYRSAGLWDKSLDYKWRKEAKGTFFEAIICFLGIFSEPFRWYLHSMKYCVRRINEEIKFFK